MRLLRDAVEAGHRIGAIAGLSDGQVRAFLHGPPRHDAPAAVDDMLNAIRLFNGRRLDQLLAREALAMGPFDFCRLVLSPLLDRIGDGWARDEVCVAEEHMATAAIKGTLMSLMRFGRDRVGGNIMVFSTLPGERHEIGVLMAAVCAQNAGAHVFYLGADLPISEIVTVAQRLAAKVVGIGAVMPATEEQMTNLSKLKSDLPRSVGIWIGGRGWSNVEVPSGVRLVGTLEELQQRVLRRSLKA